MLTFFRILFGILFSSDLQFRQCKFHYCEGILLESAKLATGDRLLRLAHRPNNFCFNSRLQQALGKDLYRNKTVWFPAEYCEVQDEDQQSIFFFHYGVAEIPAEKRLLSPLHLYALQLRNATSNIPIRTAYIYDNVAFMNQLHFLFAGHSNRRELVNKYVELGPNHIEEAVLESNWPTSDITVYPSKLTRTVSID